MYLDSAAYSRNRNADCFGQLRENDALVLGKILFFTERDGAMFCQVLGLNVVKTLKLLHHSELPIEFNEFLPPVFAYIVNESEQSVSFRIDSVVNKMFCLIFDGKMHLITLLKHFEHD